MRTCIHTIAIIALIIPSLARAGMQLEVTDPLYFEREHEVIFPWSDAKLVTLEFESVTDIEGGKEKAEELHDLFLRKIRGLPGGSVLTYVATEGQKIENHRVVARKAAEQQNAQMTLWGKIYPDKTGVSLINVRLELIEPPNGIQSLFKRQVSLSQATEKPISGYIKDEITQTRIDFLTVEEANVGALAEFLSGLAFYYKGAKGDDEKSRRLLQTSIAHMGKYLEETHDRIDYSAASAAHTYMARAEFRLSRMESAEKHARKAIDLNPYESDPYTVLAVILGERGGNDDDLEKLLSSSVSHAPGSAAANYNLALVKSGSGQLKDAIQKLDQVEYLQMQEQQFIYEDVKGLQHELRNIESARQH